MIDFIEVQPAEFNRLKSVDMTDNQHAVKINSLLDKYTCFQDYSAFNSYSKVRKHPHTHHAHNHNHDHRHHPHNHVHHILSKKTVIGNNTKTVAEREMTGLLNKLSKRNYPTIVKQILKIVCTTPQQPTDPKETHTHVVISCILDKCQKQPCFIELYVSLLNDIHTKSTIECRALIRTQLNEYIDIFIKQKEFHNYQLDSLNYDEFCTNLNNKAMIIGRHKTIIALITKVLRTNMIDQYFNIMFNEVIQMDKHSECPKVEKHELLLDIMMDFVQNDPKYKNFMVKYYSTHPTVLQEYSMKSKFKVLDMTNISITAIHINPLPQQ